MSTTAPQRRHIGGAARSAAGTAVLAGALVFPGAAGAAPTDSRTTEGGVATIYLGTPALGLLQVHVQTVRAVGGTATSVVYERYVSCARDEAVGGVQQTTCRRAWTERRTLGFAAFTVDAALNKATLTDTLRGQPVSLTWTGRTTTSTHRGATDVLIFRNADGELRWGWGPKRHPDDRKNTTGLYRRVSVRV